MSMPVMQGNGILIIIHRLSRIGEGFFQKFSAFHHAEPAHDQVR
jgi:hypothetical protein